MTEHEATEQERAATPQDGGASEDDAFLEEEPSGEGLPDEAAAELAAVTEAERDELAALRSELQQLRGTPSTPSARPGGPPSSATAARCSQPSRRCRRS